MKKNYPVTILMMIGLIGLLIASFTLWSTTAAAKPAHSPNLVSAAFPICIGFEDEKLPPSMTPFVTTVGDSIGLVTVTNRYPYMGNYALDLSTNIYTGKETEQAAILAVNLANRKNVELSFWVQGHGNEPNPGKNGVFISTNGGKNYSLIYNLSAGEFDYQLVVLDLGAEAKRVGLSLTNNFFIKFQSVDNSPIPLDGYSFDDICVQSWAPHAGVSTQSVPYTAENGTPFTYTIAINNVGFVTATQVSLINPVPTNSTYLSGSVTAEATYFTPANQIEWQGNIPPTSTVAVSFAVVTTASINSVITNTARISQATLAKAITALAETLVVPAIGNSQNITGTPLDIFLECNADSDNEGGMQVSRNGSPQIFGTSSFEAGALGLYVNYKKSCSIGPGKLPSPNNYNNWLCRGQSAVSGNGTTAAPYSVSSKLGYRCEGDLITLDYTTRYVNNQDYFRLNWKICGGTANQSVSSFLAADFDLFGKGYYDTATHSVGTLLTSTQTMFLTPLTPLSSHYFEDTPVALWSLIGSINQPANGFRDAILNKEHDTAAGLQWDLQFGADGCAAASAMLSFTDKPTPSPIVEITTIPNSSLALPNSNITFTVTITNAGPITLTDIILADSAVPTCVQPVANIPPVSSANNVISFTCAMPTVMVDVTSTVTITANGGLVTDQSSAFVQIAKPSLRVDKQANVSHAKVGDTITYSYQISNTGNVTLHVIAEDDRLKSILGQTALSPQQTIIISRAYLVSATDFPVPLTNTVTVTGDTLIGLVVVVSDTVTVSLAPDLILSQTVTPTLAAIGSSLTYTLIVTNNSFITATHLTLTDTLPLEVKFISVSTNCQDISASMTRTVVCTWDKLLPESSANISLAVKAMSGGFLTNHAVIAAQESEVTLTNNTAIATSTIKATVYLPVIVKMK